MTNCCQVSSDQSFSCFCGSGSGTAGTARLCSTWCWLDWSIKVGVFIHRGGTSQGCPSDTGLLGWLKWVRCLGPCCEMLVGSRVLLHGALSIWPLPVSLQVDSSKGHIAAQGSQRHKSSRCQAFWRLRPRARQRCFHSVLLVRASHKFSLGSMERDVCLTS